MERFVMYKPAEVTASGRTEFFSGFTFKHPGTEKNGRMIAQWDKQKAHVMTLDERDNAVRDLERMNDYNGVYISQLSGFM